MTSSDASDGRVLQVMRWSARTSMPWRNGGGVTHELFRDEALRLSVAEVAGPGPFSVFPGVDRVLTLLDGVRCVLRRGDVSVSLRPLVPFAFHGDDAWGCTDVEGPAPGRPAMDFNVMMHRDAGTASVRLARVGVHDAAWLLALGPGQVGGQAVNTWDLARCDGPVTLSVPALAVTVSPLA
jgi:environmental stress-induced protein Ves